MPSISGLGRLAAMPELKLVGENRDKEVLEVRIKMSDGRLDRSTNNWIDRGYWADVSLWGPCAKAAAQLFKTGDKVFIVGQQYLHKWEHEGKGYEQMRIDANFMLPYTPDLESLEYKPRKKSNPSNEESSSAPNHSDDSIPFSEPQSEAEPA